MNDCLEDIGINRTDGSSPEPYQRAKSVPSSRSIAVADCAYRAVTLNDAISRSRSYCSARTAECWVLGCQLYRRRNRSYLCLDSARGGHVALGDLYLLGTVLSGAFGYALSGRLSMCMPGWEVVSWQVAGFLPVSILVTLALWPHDLSAIPLPAWCGLAYVGLISQYFAFFVFNAAMAMTGVARAGQLMLLQPFVIIALATLVNGEPFRLSTLAYAGAVVATVFIGQRTSIQRK